MTYGIVMTARTAFRGINRVFDAFKFAVQQVIYACMYLRVLMIPRVQLSPTRGIFS